MATRQPNLSIESPPAVPHPARRAQRIAVIMFAVFSTLAAVAGIRSWTTAQWPLWIGMAVLAAYAVATLVAWRQFGAGRLTRGGWILISGLYFVFPIGAVLTEGTSLAFALCLFTLTMLLARATLPQADTARAIVIALALSAVTLILGVVAIPVRAQVPYADAWLPFLTVGLLVGLVVLLVRSSSTFSLRAKLIFMSLTVSLVPLGVIGLVFAINAQQNATAAANQALAAASRETAASLDTFIQTNLNDVRVASQIPELADILRSTDRESAAYADAEARATGILRSLRRRDPIFLRSYALLDQDGNNLLDTSRIDMGLSEANRNYFVSPRTDNLPYVSPVTSEPNTGRPSVYFSAPMRDSSGAFLGVLRARYDALVLQEAIFNNNGLAGTESGAILLDENNIKLADGLQPDTLLKVISPEFERGLANAAQQPIFEAELEADQDKEQVAVSSLNTQPWKVAFSRSQTEFLAPLNQQTRLILLGGLLIVLLVAGVAALAAQAIARPVIALTETAQKVSQGDLSARASVTTQDEIGTLARTFNSMTDQLRGMVVTLEDRVQARTDQLRASAEVGRAATSILNSDQLLEQVANLITTRFGFYYAAVFTLDEQGQFALLRAATGEAGRTLLERRHRLPVNRESMVGGAIMTQRPRIALDVGEGAVRFANPLLPNTRSEIALPLRVGERVMGALDVQSEAAGAFDEARAEVLQAMADQIAVALVNAETFNRSEQQAHYLTRINQLSRELAQATSREHVALAVAQAVIDLVGPSRMVLVETTPNAETLAMRTIQPEADRPLGDVLPISAFNSLSGECLRSGELIYVPDLSTLLNKYEDVDLVHAAGVRSSVALPLRIGERIIGTFNVASNQLNAYSPEQLNRLEQVAAQVAVTLDSLNLAKQTQEALGELDAANRRLVGQAWSTYTQAGGMVNAEWLNGEWNTTHRQRRRAATAPSRALVAAAQSVTLPIKVRGTTIGEFNVAPDAGQPDWTSEEVAFAQSLIDQVGQVLENARLLEETERSAQREKAVADAADKIHRSTDIETVLQSAISELNRITGRRGISIQLGFGQSSRTDTHGHDSVPEGDR